MSTTNETNHDLFPRVEQVSTWTIAEFICLGTRLMADGFWVEDQWCLPYSCT